MTATTNGYIWPAVGYTDGWRQAIEDLADSAETVLVNRRALQWFRPADAAALTALQDSYTLVEGDRATQTDTKVTYRWNGTAWKAWESDWIVFTSTLTNITVGTGGTQSLRYKYEQGRIYVRGPITLGSAAFSVASGPTMTLPVTSAALGHAYQTFAGNTRLYDTSGILNAMGHVTANNTSTTVALIWSTSSTTGNYANTTSTAPFTWAAGDVFDIDFFYDPA